MILEFLVVTNAYDGDAVSIFCPKSCPTSWPTYAAQDHGLVFETVQKVAHARLRPPPLFGQIADGRRDIAALELDIAARDLFRARRPGPHSDKADPGPEPMIASRKMRVPEYAARYGYVAEAGVAHAITPAR